MKGTGNFDQNAYWIQRHKRLKGNPKSVGNLGKTLEQNIAAEKRIRYWVGHAAHILRPYASVLDVGCGYGRVASVFCDAGYDYTGIDVSAVATKAAKRNEPRGSYVVGSALETDLGRKFDLICVLYVFVHFVGDQEWRQLVFRLASLLPSGGGLLFADNFPAERQNSSAHATQRPLSMYEKVFAGCGLQLDPSFRERLAAALAGVTPLPAAYLARKLV
jgi:SAM-dependent methyltransferase